MDAKPQRTFRALPALGNENVAPPNHTSKLQGKAAINTDFIYSTNGSLNAPPKRTAFGDVSNLAQPSVGGAKYNNNNNNNNNNNAGKDSAQSSETLKQQGADGNIPWSIINGRKVYFYPALPTETSSASTVQLHGLLPNPVKAEGKRGSFPTATAPLANLGQVSARFGSSQPPAVVKAGTARKTTFVYHDNKELDVGPYSSIPRSRDDSHSFSGVERQAENPRRYQSQPQLKSTHSLHHVPARKLVRSGRLGTHQETGSTSQAVDEPTGAAYVDALEHQSVGHAVSEKPLSAFESLHADVLAMAKVQQYGQEQGQLEPERRDAQLLQPVEHKYMLASATEQEMPLPDDRYAQHHEENWDDADDQDPDAYDDQAYTTAHSYRSVGDTTSMALTTIVAPEVTSMALLELNAAREVVEACLDPDDLDEEDWDISMVSEYNEDIFQYMRTLEVNLLPNPHYMDIQTEIQWSMRSILMDWIVQIHGRFQLLPETLFLTANYIDRFLSVKVVSLGKLQLVGITALFLASKYEEINCPSIAEVVYMVDSGYSAEEILKAERFMLTMLQFELGWPGPMSFLRRVSKADEYDLETRTMAKYFLEVTLMDERFIACPPSYVAAGAQCLARMLLGRGPWTPAHTHYSGYTIDQLKPLVGSIWECVQEPAAHHHAVYTKYANKKYKAVAVQVEDEVRKGGHLVFPPSVLAVPENAPGSRQQQMDQQLQYLISVV